MFRLEGRAQSRPRFSEIAQPRTTGSSSLHDIAIANRKSEAPNERENETNDRQDQENVNGAAKQMQA